MILPAFFRGDGGGVLRNAFAGDGEIERNEKDIEYGGEQRKVQAQPATAEIPAPVETDSRAEHGGDDSERVEA